MYVVSVVLGRGSVARAGRLLYIVMLSVGRGMFFCDADDVLRGWRGGLGVV